MVRFIIVNLISSLLYCTHALAARDDNAAYSALLDFASISSKTINSAGCLVTGTIDFGGFVSKLDVFKEAWLNRDYSADFYAQRRKQVFIYIVVKRYAELITEGLFHNEKPSSVCSFSINAKYDDIYGKTQDMTVVTWKFDQTTNGKVVWENFDPRDFARIAIDYKITPEAMSWLSDEPSMAEKKSSDDQKICQPDMLKANAVFIRATTYCSKNYMDSPAGYYALAMSRQCAKSMGEETLKAITTDAMKQLDGLARQRGRVGACRWVQDVERNVLRKVAN
ncbi:hypothetical protein [Methylocapsa acidiphila]|uniref:hypothetical protein n=1 Tax=Methylocapsa acidiphila TaxID=133552 RepID=UPI0012EC5855|nr:hypothetical protein [Methylocapsa acidiphila]